VSLLVLILAMAAASAVEYRFRARRRDEVLANATTYQHFLRWWLVRRVPSLVVCVPIALLSSQAWLAGGLFLVFTGRRLVTKGTHFVAYGSAKSLRQQAVAANDEWIASLGATHAERAKKIDALFDERTVTLEAVHFDEGKRYIGQAEVETFYFCKVRRSLAGMDTRERTYLRAVELLNSAAEGKDGDYRLWKTALLWGDGKGTAYDEQSWSKNGVKEKSGDRAADPSQRLPSVDDVANRVQLWITQLKSSPNGNADLREIAEEFGDVLTPTGSGSWLKPSQLVTSPYATRSEHALSIGSFPDGSPLSYSGDGSMVTIAPPGSGKTQCNVFPNLLTWRGPAVVLDISGDLFEHTSAWRAENVGPVYKFSPLEPESSHRYNPLTFVRSESDDIWEDSRLLAEMMIVPALSSDPFWENEARTVLTAAIAHVCYANPPDARPVHAVLDILFGGDAWERMLLGLRMAVDVRVMTQHATALAAMNEKTLSSVLQTARSSLGAWTGERVARATVESDWSPLDLRSDKNPTLYVYMRPNEVDAYLSLLRVIIGQHIRMLTGGPVPPRDAPPILFMLDELPRLRNMPPIDEALNIGRKYGLRLWMFAQSVGQFRTAYENADGMLSSCAVRIFMNPSGADGLAEQLSEELGYVESIHDNSRRRLIEAAELAGPTYGDKQVVIGSGAKPVIVSKDFAYRSPELSGRMGAMLPLARA
jgi:type IV secretion system protein VirD4